METKHTPAPWHYEPSDMTVRTKNFQSNAGMGDYRGIIICEIDPDNWRGCRPDSIPEKEANGRLIAAAPDLLEACKETLRQMSEQYVPADVHDDEWCALYRRLENAIAKAEGREP